ncbi:M15 family metallopeptidase [Microbacterium immunditiarum]|uniref:LAS superfamily LD-carboxypeptidase LdcB n=1 Tax=Microbacterium immunditiarum TaxID=337480 RepID=A0A7Y9GQB7_9MICO|nr:M15 family metallopeptidase [Microbacterium immunditiarum]NYE20702.1 LAS superfamily LD-carboxypeptidase LdcB [Microbacterium immunditiarum]
MRRQSAEVVVRRTIGLALVGTVIAGTALVGSLVLQTVPSSAESVASTPAAPPLLEPDGSLPAGVTAFDDEYAGVARVSPDLLEALRAAATAAEGEGIRFFVNSGWRSPEYQTRLLDDAVAEYGSREEAARWVATAETSPHVTGDAVDVGETDATSWLSQHGAAFGLCQIYANERWHFELRPQAVTEACPPMFPDPTFDPRMQG